MVQQDGEDARKIVALRMISSPHAPETPRAHEQIGHSESMGCALVLEQQVHQDDVFFCVFCRLIVELVGVLGGRDRRFAPHGQRDHQICDALSQIIAKEIAGDDLECVEIEGCTKLARKEDREQRSCAFPPAEGSLRKSIVRLFDRGVVHAASTGTGGSRYRRLAAGVREMNVSCVAASDCVIASPCAPEAHPSARGVRWTHRIQSGSTHAPRSDEVA